MKDIIGQEFSRWTVVSVSHKDKYNNHYYNCRCKCGNERVVSRGNLKSKLSKSCGCFHKTIIRKLPFEALYNRFVRDSKKRDLVVELTFPKFLRYTQILICHYCGGQVIWLEHGQHGGYNLDRKDNSKGYSTDNCIVCCGICNRMKNTMTYGDFIGRCKSICKQRF